MKILDRYVAKNFLVGYLITALVLLGLCTVIDLFVNLDEFAENTDLGAAAVLRNIWGYYSNQIMLWFRDLAGFITVIAAVFSLTRMTYNNELIAVMASGVSLKRMILPILVLSIGSMSLLVLDQEILIPGHAAKLIRSHDYVEGAEEEIHDLWFMSDNGGKALICTRRFDGRRMHGPMFLLREEVPGTLRWRVIDIIRADSAAYDEERGGWVLENGRYVRMGTRLDEQPIAFFASELTPDLIPLKQQEGYKSFLSSAQLNEMARHEKRIRDTAELYLHKHARVTDPVMNLVMLMISLPVLVRRDPKTMKSAILKSFVLVTFAFGISFMCKLFATEEFFHQVRPELWTWAPIIIFLPIAFMEFDSMKT